ncbi:MAG: hypothetical protein AB8F78_15620 [Saprospiraceae bacterium]
MKEFLHFLVAFIAQIAFLSQPVCAQVPAHHMTQGLPWTVVDESELPPEALDSTYRNILIDYVGDNAEIRYLFRVYFHPELTEIIDDKIYAELPREPGITEIVNWNSGRIDSSQIDGTGNNDYIYYRGNESSHPSISPSSFLNLSYVIGLDSSLGSYPEAYYGLINFAPASYELFGGPPGSGAHRYGYFIQVVDSIYHPQVSSVREPLSKVQVSAYPNPCTNRFTIDIPELWRQKLSTVTIFQRSTGQMVVQNQLTLGQEQINFSEEVISGLTPGIYTAFLRREDGEGGVAFTNFVKQ